MWFNSCKALALWKIDLNKTEPLVIKVFSMRFISVIRLKYNRIYLKRIIIVVEVEELFVNLIPHVIRFDPLLTIKLLKCSNFSDTTLPQM